MYFVKQSKKNVLILLLSLIQGCAVSELKSKPGSEVIKVVPAALSDSPAYQYGLTEAFADLRQRQSQQQRNPASESNQSWWHKTFKSNFKRSARLEILVFPRSVQIPNSRTEKELKPRIDKPTSFMVNFLSPRYCKIAEDWLKMPSLKDCHVAEIKPKKRQGQRGQMVRVFLDGENRVYGLSYYPYDEAKQDFVKVIKNQVWDPAEPLSSELLAQVDTLFPIDLPLYASNRLKSDEDLVSNISSVNELLRHSTAGRTTTLKNCKGLIFHYRNAYGSSVTGGWCQQDLWPTVIETNRYIAVLKTALIEKRGNH